MEKIPAFYILKYNFRPTTVGDFFDKAVDKTLNNQQFMSYAKSQKRQVIFYNMTSPENKGRQIHFWHFWMS